MTQEQELLAGIAEVIAKLAVGQQAHFGNIIVSRWLTDGYRTYFAGPFSKHNDDFTPSGAAKRVFEYAKLPEFKPNA